MNIYLSEIDERRFGVVTAKAEIDSQYDISATNVWCNQRGVRFLIARCDVNHIAHVKQLEDDGYRLMDTLVHMRFDISKPFPEEQASMFLVRPMQQGDCEAIREIAMESFSDYLIGHYHCDPMLRRDDCTDVYVDWAVNTAQANDDNMHILVAEDKATGKVIGFLSNRFRQDALEAFLSGVYKSSRGQGVYKHLFCAALRAARDNSRPYLITSTQINNRASIGMWSRLGFEMVRAEYTFHKWFERA